MFQKFESKIVGISSSVRLQTDAFIREPEGRKDENQLLLSSGLSWFRIEKWKIEEQTAGRKTQQQHDDKRRENRMIFYKY